MITQLSLFSQGSEDVPLPLLVARKWGFALDQQEKDGVVYYRVMDWLTGLVNEKYAKQTIRNLRRPDDFFSQCVYGVHTFQEQDSKNRLRVIEYATDEILYKLTQRIRSDNAGVDWDDTPISAVCDYLAKAGVKLDEWRRDPEKAESFWGTAKVAKWLREGKSREWIEKRLKGQDSRHKITDEWKDRGAQGSDYAILSNEVNVIALGQSATQMSKELQVKPGQLRDHLDQAEIGVLQVVEASASTLHTINNSSGVDELKQDVRDTNPIAEAARRVFNLAKRKAK